MGPPVEPLTGKPVRILPEADEGDEELAGGPFPPCDDDGGLLEVAAATIADNMAGGIGDWNAPAPIERGSPCIICCCCWKSSFCACSFM